MKPFLIGISGGSGSGKTTLADALFEKLGPDRALLVGDDNYYRTRAEQGAVGWSEEKVEAHVNFDDSAAKDMALFRSHIEALKAGQKIEQPVYDFATHDRVIGASTSMEAKPIILVEGIHVLSDPETTTLFDLTVFVDTPDDLRLARRIKRDVRERGRDLDRVIAQYLKFVRPTYYRVTHPAKYTCDLVIADEGLPAYGHARPSARAVERMIAPVLGRLPEG